VVAPPLKPGGPRPDPWLPGPRARACGFVLLFAAFTVLWQALADTPALLGWIESVVVPVAALWLGAASALFGFGPVAADGARLVGEAAALNVLPGCEGSDAMLLVAAAVLVAPRSGGQRLLGLLLLGAAVFALNQARLGGLLWALAEDRALFEQLHTLWLPLALVGASVGLVVLWLQATAPAKPRAVA
jgi:exosortase/archaeosortase family protein